MERPLIPFAPDAAGTFFSAISSSSYRVFVLLPHVECVLTISQTDDPINPLTPTPTAIITAL